MSGLKAENVKKCVFLLRDFIQESQALNNKKEIATVALNHLQEITAGKNAEGYSNKSEVLSCAIIPRIDGTPNRGNG